MSGRVLVTGGDGFIGQHVKHLCVLESRKKLENRDVRVLDKEEGGILNTKYLAQAMEGVETVLHLGACSGNLFMVDDDADLGGIRVNVEGTRNVLELARRKGVRRVVFVSTQSSYAHAPLPHHEDDLLDADINLYTATKVFGESLCRAYHRRYGLETVILRFSSVYGPGEESKGPVANPITLFIRKMLKGEAPVLYGDGYQTRDLLFVEDAARAVLHAAGSNVQPGQTYNVSTGRATTFRRVVELINGVLCSDLQPSFAPFPSAGLQTEYVRSQWTDNAKLRATGWEPEVAIEEGIRRTVEHFAKVDGKSVPLLGPVVEPDLRGGRCL